jgi:N utilization substance protein B|tara:strand:+ start:213 stop:608 length:396 start_codon:yes stop_codon:yes gene_type:complete
MTNIAKDSTPRVKIIQKLYSKILNPGEKITYNKSQYKKFIKDVTEGTLERIELIEETIEKFLKNDIDLKKTDKLLKLIIYAAVFELLYKHNNPKKVIISEYLKTSHFFLEKAQIKYLNAILDKLSGLIRKN